MTATFTSRDIERMQAHEKTGRCAFECIKEMVEALEGHEAAATAEGWTGPFEDEYGGTYFKNEAEGCTWACSGWLKLCEEHDIDAERSEDAERVIHDDPLSVMVRDGWHEVGKPNEDGPEEYEILLSTGGPATRIVGKLNQHCEPDTARLEVQDWFVPWQEWRGKDWSENILLDYARCFYFGD
jgi:hypothetical protein